MALSWPPRRWIGADPNGSGGVCRVSSAHDPGAVPLADCCRTVGHSHSRGLWTDRLDLRLRRGSARLDIAEPFRGLSLSRGSAPQALVGDALSTARRLVKSSGRDMAIWPSTMRLRAWAP